MNILFIGDIVGQTGRDVVAKKIIDIKNKYNIYFTVANGGNSAGGRGITYLVSQELFDLGIDVITMGNHTWSRKEILNFIDNQPKVIRPANYPQKVPGKCKIICDVGNIRVAVINLIGRVYMEPVDCPFKAAEKEISAIKSKADVILIDFHAEATSEKQAMAWYFDGKVSCVLGTHTHVQTADERILPGGTGYITDVGMTGPYDGILGVKKEEIFNKFIDGMPWKFELEDGRAVINAGVITINDKTFKTEKIERINEIIIFLG